jgi:Predicted hydrolases or acyltransferases (alpha/beta hydrolase superfamily)
MNFNKTRFLSYFTRHCFSTKPAHLSFIYVPSTNPNPNYTMVWLHGLFGNAKNFKTNMTHPSITSQVESYSLDLRNQGDSEHRKTMTYAEVAEDVYSFILRRHLQNVILLGHSYGARVAMKLLTRHPNDFKAAIIADMAPYDYWGDKEYVYIRGLKRIIGDLLKADLHKNKEAIRRDFEIISGDRDIALSLIGAIEKDPEGGFKWKANLETIYENFSQYIVGDLFSDHDPYAQKFKGPVKVIYGGKSDYVIPKSIPSFHTVFENFDEKRDMVELPDCGHFVHFERPEEFSREVANFLSSLNSRT